MRQMRGNSKYLDQVSSRRAFHHAGMSITVIGLFEKAQSQQLQRAKHLFPFREQIPFFI
jgi:hypothetical protein